MDFLQGCVYLRGLLCVSMHLFRERQYFVLFMVVRRGQDVVSVVNGQGARPTSSHFVVLAIPHKTATMFSFHIQDETTRKTASL